MIPYGGKKTSGYTSSTNRPSCKCCNGSYAKVGRSSNKQNAIRGLKKSARQEDKTIIKEEVKEADDFFYDIRYTVSEFERESFSDYNDMICWRFMYMLSKLVPELYRVDELDCDSWGTTHSEGLNLLPSWWNGWRPPTAEKFTERLEQLIKEG